MGHVGSKTRSLDQIIEEPILCNSTPHNLGGSGVLLFKSYYLGCFRCTNGNPLSLFVFESETVSVES